MVKKQTKKLEKKAVHDLMDDDDTTNYTRFGNDEFEALFGGENRNNDVEFNLLFTPLSQKAELALIKSVKPFGDDFFFDKQKKLNYIKSYHSQRFNYDQDARMFFNYDYEKARAKFINYNDNYFTNLYFDLAPLFAIPLYQQHKSLEYIYKGIFKNMVSPFEYEIFANNSWYFRNALVRANYNNLPKNIIATTEYLELFFEKE